MTKIEVFFILKETKDAGSSNSSGCEIDAGSSNNCFNLTGDNHDR